MFERQPVRVERRESPAGIRSLFAVPSHGSRADTAFLLIRVVTGTALMIHGSQKLAHPFAWLPDPWAPAWLLGLATLSEFGGGLALILGLLTPLASFGIACTMLTASYAVAIRMHMPFVNLTGGPSWELSAAYFCIAVLLIAAGPGRVSLDRAIFGRR